MDEVQINDKVFGEYLSEEEIQARVKELARELDVLFRGKRPALIVVLKGSFVFAADLVKAMELDVELHFIRVSSYGNEMESSGQINELIGLDADLEGKEVIIVEDIVDTGRTLDWLIKTLDSYKMASVRTVTLLFKEDAYKYEIPPDIIGFSIPNHFVVGYGLDYAEGGRGLRAIYQLKEE
ncbi:MAG: hypoxanthine phosphoribosyltransferase [Bacteroidia bacterium]|nr:hypoxanthine phosphoribosyltransferase [Bacteroidia bacterium]